MKQEFKQEDEISCGYNKSESAGVGTGMQEIKSYKFHPRPW